MERQGAGKEDRGIFRLFGTTMGIGVKFECHRQTEGAAGHLGGGGRGAECGGGGGVGRRGVGCDINELQTKADALLAFFAQRCCRGSRESEGRVG